MEVFYHLGEGGETHPPPHQRVASAGEGWEAGHAKTVETYPPPDDREYPQDEGEISSLRPSTTTTSSPPTSTSSSPPPLPMATACVHLYGPLLYVAPNVRPTNPGRFRLSLQAGVDAGIAR